MSLNAGPTIDAFVVVLWHFIAVIQPVLNHHLGRGPGEKDWAAHLTTEANYEQEKARRFRDDVFFNQISPWTSPSARRISTSTEESHPLNSLALLATILNDVFTFGIGGASLKFHCLFAYQAVQETYERAFIVVRMISPGHSFPLRFQRLDPHREFSDLLKNVAAYRPRRELASSL